MGCCVHTSRHHANRHTRGHLAKNAVHQLLTTKRRYASVGSGLFLIYESLKSAYYGVVSHDSVIGAFALVVGMGGLGVGLVFHKFWARRIAAALCVCVAIFLPLGEINPFTAMDSPDPPSLSALLAWIIPTVVGLLATAWLIDPPRQRNLATAIEKSSLRE
jgi:hypothetical protein